MTTLIPYDDLEPDMWVTIRDLPEEEEPPPFGDPFLEAMRMRHRRPSVVMQAGVPMRILAVDLPFLYLAVMNAEGTETGPLTLDLREQPVVGLDETVAHISEQLQASKARCEQVELSMGAIVAEREREIEGLREENLALKEKHIDA